MTTLKTWHDCVKELYAEGYSHVSFNEYSALIGEGRKSKPKRLWARIVATDEPDNCKRWPPSDQDSASDCGFRIVYI